MPFSPSTAPLSRGLRHVLGLLMLTWLAACGGGGGGGGGGNEAAAGMQIRFDRNTVSLMAEENPQPGQGGQVIQASATGGDGNESLFIGAEQQGVGLVLPIDVTLDTTARTARITLMPNATLAPGTYTGTVRLLACKDALCAAHHGGSPFTVSYTTVITPRFKASVASLAFAAVETVQPAAQPVLITLPQGVSSSTAAVEYPAGVAPWLELSPQGQDYQVRPQATLAVGNYAAVLRLEAGAGRAPLRIPVQHRVSAGMVVAAALDLAIDSRSPAGSASGEVPITVAAGVNATQWAASSDQAWLRLVAPTGTLGTPLRWQLDGQAFAGLLNQASHEAMVTVTAPGSGLAAQTLRVRLLKDVAELVGADTLAVQAGEAGEVLLYGRRLDQLANPSAAVAATGLAPLQVSVRSAALMSLQVPALAAGSHDISLNTASGLPTRSVRLLVTEAQDRHETWVDSPGQKGSLMWDAAQQAVFVLDSGQGAVLRILPSSSPAGTTLALRSRLLPGLAGLALSPDRRSLIATTQAGQLLRLAPDDLRTLASRDLGRPLEAQWPAQLPLMVTADQFLLATGGNQWAAVLAQDLVRDAAVSLSNSTYTFYSGPWGVVSGNGQRLLATQTAGLSPQPPLLRRDGLTTELLTYPSSSEPRFFYQVATDRRGTRWLLDNQRLVDFNLSPLGLLPSPLPGPWYPQTSALSRDGSRAYVFAMDAAVSASRIFVFDLSAAVGPTQTFPLLGTIQPLLSPSCLSPTTTDSCNGYQSRMVLTDDDRTLVLAGDRRIGLVPVPLALRGGVPSAQAARAPHALVSGQR